MTDKKEAKTTWEATQASIAADRVAELTKAVSGLTELLGAAREGLVTTRKELATARKGAADQEAKAEHLSSLLDKGYKKREKLEADLADLRLRESVARRLFLHDADNLVKFRELLEAEREARTISDDAITSGRLADGTITSEPPKIKVGVKDNNPAAIDGIASAVEDAVAAGVKRGYAEARAEERAAEMRLAQLGLTPWGDPKGSAAQ